jgi:hypothetical protein
MFPVQTPFSSTPASLRLPLGLLSSYLFFLLRRPISASNVHYLEQRLRGFRSLTPLFEAAETEQLRAIAKGLRRLQPSNFARTARELQFRLLAPGSGVAIPPDFIISGERPSASPFSGVRKIVIVTGPAIGIGDEIILFPLPSWIKAANPGAEISAVSGYAGLWNGVNGVDQVLHYRTHRELLDVLRGEAELVLLADFEKPGLVPLIACEPGNSIYVELSLGAQCAAVVNRNSRRVWTVNTPLDATLNYYEAFSRLLEWIGITPELSGRYCGTVRQSPKPSGGALRIFVSPYTSKYEPSPIYWSRILASLVPRSPRRAVEFVLDPGAGPSTERFSTAVSGSAAARAVPGVSFSLAGEAGSRTLSLAGVFSELERAHVVICADSFAAHAAPQFGCTTLVVARAGSENWRTPSPRSFYFDLEQPMDEMLAAMREILEACYPRVLDRPRQKVPFEASASRMDHATRELNVALEHAGTSCLGTIHAARRRFLESHRALIETIPTWPPEFRGLVHQDGLSRAWRELDEHETDLRDREVIRHLQLELRNWEQTNLCRFARLVGMDETSEAALGESG